MIDPDRIYLCLTGCRGVETNLDTARMNACATSKSITVVDASEFSAALKLAIAAARIAAVTKPATPTGRCRHTNSG